jgi:hypothetical protein
LQKIWTIPSSFIVKKGVYCMERNWIDIINGSRLF